MHWSESLREMERKLRHVARTFWEIMYYAETLHLSVKSVQMRSFFWSVSFCIQTKYGDLFSPNTGKYGPKKALYLDTFYAVYIQKNKDFEIQFPRRNKWVQQYITLHMKVGCVKWHILLVSANWQFWKLSGVICS